MEATEWDDILVQKGIKKPSNTANKVDTNAADQQIINERKEKVIDLLDLEEEDEEDIEMIRQLRIKRMNEMKEQLSKRTFADVREITKQDYVNEVNNAGDGIYVVLHIYKPGIPLCTLINQHFNSLAVKFPRTKFLKSVSSLCIPNYPDTNLPTIFVYFNGEMKKQFIGAKALDVEYPKIEDLEWILSRTGAIETELEEDPRKHKKRLSNSVFECIVENDGDDEDD